MALKSELAADTCTTHGCTWLRHHFTAADIKTEEPKDLGVCRVLCILGKSEATPTKSHQYGHLNMSRAKTTAAWARKAQRPQPYAKNYRN